MELVARHVRVLRKTTHGYPVGIDEQKWDEILSDIVYAAEMYASDFCEVCTIRDDESYETHKRIHEKVYKDRNDIKFPTKEEWQRAIRGIDYFKQYMFSLWD